MTADTLTHSLQQPGDVGSAIRSFKQQMRRHGPHDGIVAEMRYVVQMVKYYQEVYSSPEEFHRVGAGTPGNVYPHYVFHSQLREFLNAYGYPANEAEWNTPGEVYPGLIREHWTRADAAEAEEWREAQREARQRQEEYDRERGRGPNQPRLPAPPRRQLPRRAARDRAALRLERGEIFDDSDYEDSETIDDPFYS
jgi:hypothetical protein